MKNTNSALRLIAEILAIAGLLFHALLILGAWNLLPASIPVHFGFTGQVNASGDKNDLLLLFGLNVLVYVGLTLLSLYPHKFNYPWQITPSNAVQQYNLAGNFLRVIKCETVWIFSIISLQIVGISLGFIGSLSSFFVPSLVAVTGLTGIIYMILASRSANEGRALN